MVNKKLSIADIIFLIILLWLLSIFGCTSTVPREDSNHYRAQIQHSYPCPECGYQIPMENINENIRIENKCPNCGKIFFGVPVEKSKVKSESRGKPYQGPNVLVRGYHHNIKHDGNTKYSFENSWKISKDGNSGKMSSTTIRKSEYTTKGESGRTTGPAGLGRSGGY